MNRPGRGAITIVSNKSCYGHTEGTAGKHVAPSSILESVRSHSIVRAVFQDLSSSVSTPVQAKLYSAVPFSSLPPGVCKSPIWETVQQILFQLKCSHVLGDEIKKKPIFLDYMLDSYNAQAYILSCCSKQKDLF